MTLVAWGEVLSNGTQLYASYFLPACQSGEVVQQGSCVLAGWNYI